MGARAYFLFIIAVLVFTATTSYGDAELGVAALWDNPSKTNLSGLGCDITLSQLPTDGMIALLSDAYFNDGCEMKCNVTCTAANGEPSNCLPGNNKSVVVRIVGRIPKSLASNERDAMLLPREAMKQIASPNTMPININFDCK